MPLKSWRVVFQAEPDVDQAAGTWEMSAHGRRVFQSFGWHRCQETSAERTFKGAKRGPVLCPYCGGRMYDRPFDREDEARAWVPRDRALFMEAGVGPP